MKKLIITLLLIGAFVGVFFIGRFSVRAERIIRENPVVLSIATPEKIQTIDFFSPHSDKMTLFNLRGDRVFNITSDEQQWDVIVNWKDGGKSEPLRIQTQEGIPVHISIGSSIVKSDDVSMWKFLWLRMKS
jgi:hypothetical protein